MVKSQLPITSLESPISNLSISTRLIARRVIYHERVGSTNDVAKQLAEDGEPEGTLVIADAQTAGRGRLGRTWCAPPHSSLLMSLILRPALAPHQSARVTMAVALGASDAIRAETGLAARLKWPNDILVNAKKCAGILAESGIVGEQLEYVIVGLGLNVNFAAASIANIPRDATTIADELGREFPRAQLAGAILAQIEHYYLRLRAGENLRALWVARLATLGQRVRAQTDSEIIEAVAENVDDDGALIVRRADGTRARLLAGDVTLAEK
jgi:BirA family biotin operon repressor/biotin-[acetyl-CoA-carboxylase] ligase